VCIYKRVETFTHIYTHTHVFLVRERVEHKTGLNLQYPSSVGKYLSTATHMAALLATPPPTCIPSSARWRRRIAAP